MAKRNPYHKPEADGPNRYRLLWDTAQIAWPLEAALHRIGYEPGREGQYLVEDLETGEFLTGEEFLKRHSPAKRTKAGKV